MHDDDKPKSNANNATLPWEKVKDQIPHDVVCFAQMCASAGVKNIRAVLFDAPLDEEETTHVLGKSVTLVVREEEDYDKMIQLLTETCVMKEIFHTSGKG